MEIKRAEKRIFARFFVNNFKKLVLKRKRIKWLILFVVSFFVLLSIVLLSIYYGMILHRSGTAVNMKEFILGVYKENFKIIPNYLSGVFLAKPEKILIDISFKNYQKLASARFIALETGSLPSSPDYEVPCSIRYKDKTYKAKIQVKGTSNDNWIQKSKWSFSVKIENNEALFGMTEFALQLPRIRDYLNCWTLHQMLADFGLPHLRYNFIDATINGIHLGIYAMEEHATKQLVESSGFYEAPIIRFDESLLWQRELPFIDDNETYSQSAIDGFQTNKLIKNEEQSKMFEKARNLLESFRRGILPVSKVFDTEKLANLFAVIDLSGHHHSTGFGVIRFYYNPVTSLLEPIGYNNQMIIPLEFQGLRSEINANEVEPIELIQSKHLNFQSAFFKDKEFFKQYVRALNKISQKEFLDNFFTKHKKDMQDKLRILYQTYPGYKFDNKKILYKNQDYIKVILNPKQAFQAYYKSFSRGSLILQLGNIQSLPVEILGVSFEDNEFFKPEKEIILQPKNTHQVIDFGEFIFKTPNDFNFSSVDLAKMKVQYKILGLDDVKTESIDNWPYFDQSFLNGDLIRQNPNWKMFSFLQTDELSKVIYIKPGFWNIKQNLIFPSGYTIVADRETTLNLSNKATILSFSPLRFLGEADHPIIIESQDKTGFGVIVLNAKEKSFLQNVHFENLSAPAASFDGNWLMTGAVNFYQSPVEFSFCNFGANLAGDDNLHLIRTQVNIFDSVFNMSLADSLDADFTQGKIARTSFYNCGLKDSNGDCLDFSGSNIELEDVFINKVGDKGISIGENTNIFGDRIKIQNASICVASKDKSVAVFNNISILNSKIGLAVYQKKSEFGPAQLSIKYLNKINIKRPYLVEEGSIMKVDEKNIKPNDKNVAEELYGK
ncbi:MAG: CotH kinase family protein [Candidatus Pacebacteria bacterium]|nr:CotH kinase family protein [Candidatus Paceibacterota bacterium]